jgi:hypothetical protein
MLIVNFARRQAVFGSEKQALMPTLHGSIELTL